MSRARQVPVMALALRAVDNHGADKVVQLVMIVCRSRRAGGGDYAMADIKDTLAGVLALDVSGDQITAVRLMSNPDKLGFASRQVARLSRLSPVTGLSYMNLILVTGGIGTLGRPMVSC